MFAPLLRKSSKTFHIPKKTNKRKDSSESFPVTSVTLFLFTFSQVHDIITLLIDLEGAV
jgi:hypothetical protein